MCGRYTLIASAEAIRLLFKVPAFDERLVPPRYNIAPTQPIVVVRQIGTERELLPVRWGFIPAWTRDGASPPLLINARAESVASRPAFLNAFRRRRCLVPASGFYEWQAHGMGPKQPFAVRPEAQKLIAFAGVWETWFGNDGSEIDTAAIITVPCNARLAALHDRMPAVIAPEHFAAWLSPGTDADEAEALLRPAPDALFTCSPVSVRVNAAANDDAGLLDEVNEEVPPAPPSAAAPRQGSLF